jgi:predicted Zn-dependent protease
MPTPFCSRKPLGSGTAAAPQILRPMSSSGKGFLRFLLFRPLIGIALAAAVVGVLLLHSHSQKTPVTHREQHVSLTDAQQMQLGQKEYAKTLRSNRRRIVSSGPQYARVQRVAKRIEVVAGRDKPAFVWRVTLIRKKEANAFCLPGGKIVVYTGILPLTENDAGLATVLGHEVAHATAEHVAERLEREHPVEASLKVPAHAGQDKITLLALACSDSARPACTSRGTR